MFFHLQYIHLFRPFLKYTPSASPLPPHVSPRRICTANAGAISKLMRLYKKTWDLRQICNIAVYMLHSACTIHLLNLLTEKTARRDIIHGLRHLEEIAEDWLCARRTLSILSVLARKWKCELPSEAAIVLQRSDEKYGSYTLSEVPSPRSHLAASPSPSEKATTGAIAAQGEQSPLSQYAQKRLALAEQPDASIGVRLASGQSAAPRSMQDEDGGLEPGADSFPTDWTENVPEITPALAAQLQNFSMPFVPIQQSGVNSTQNPAPEINMDSQEWFLNDSARWHQGFEAWNSSVSSPGGPSFMFTERTRAVSPEEAQAMLNGGPRREKQARSDSTGGVATMGPTNSLYGFEGLDASLDQGGWLPGLD